MPQTSTTVTVVYIVLPNGEQKPFGENVYNLGSTTTTTTTYIITITGDKQQTGTDLTPTPSPDVRIEIERYIITSSGERRKVGPGEPFPDNQSRATVTYVVRQDGSRRPISEEVIIVTTDTTTTTRYRFDDSGNKIKIYENIEEVIVLQSQSEIYLLNPDGSKGNLVPSGTPIPNTQSYVVVTFVTRPGGVKQVLYEEEIIRTTTETIVRKYKVTDSGVRVKVSERTIPNTQIDITKYYITLPDGTQREATPDEIALWRQTSGGGNVQKYYIIGPDGVEREVTKEEFDKLRQGGVAPSGGGNNLKIYFITDANG